MTCASREEGRIETGSEELLPDALEAGAAIAAEDRVATKRIRIARLAGLVLALLGATVMLGWARQVSPLVRVLPEYTPMAFNTALCFVLAGCGLLAQPVDTVNSRRSTTALGTALVLVATLVLAEHALRVDLGVDWRALHTWLPDSGASPGRMAPPAAAAFLLAGAAFLLAPRARLPWMDHAVWTVTLGVGVIGSLGLAGYFVGAPLLFPQYWFAGVAVHTAIGLILMALGLWAAWSRRPLSGRADDRITYIGAIVLIVTASAAGIATFAILQSRIQTLVRDELLVSLARRADVFQDLIELRETNVRIAATRPAVIRNLRAIHAGHDDGSNIANVKAVVESFLKQGFSAIAYHDADGRVVAEGGEFIRAPELSVSLGTPGKAELLWSGGFVLRHRLAMYDAAGKAGEVSAEQPLPVLTRLARQAPGRGETWDMGLCVRQEAKLVCFPQRLNPRVFSAPLANTAGELLPMTRALGGETGTTLTQDYRSQNVVAAYGPIGDLGMGMVLKVDAAEVFQPIRRQLELALGLLLLLVGAGTYLLRSQVKPLATRLVDTGEALRSLNEELERRVNERTAQLRAALDELGRSERHYRMLFEANPHPMWAYDVETLSFLAVNEAALRHYGYARDEFLGMTVLQIRPPEERAQVQSLIGSLDRAQPHRGVYRHVKRNGEVIDVEVATDGIDFSGKKARLVLAHDVTDRMRAEQEIRRLNAELELRVRQRTAELEAANRELEAFSYSVSHDLRAPLRHVDGFADMLDDECGRDLDDSGKRYLAIIRDSVRQMGRLIDDLLQFSRMGRAEMNTRQVSMADLVRDAAQETAEEGRRIEWEIEPLPEVQGDRAMLKQVWTNLLSNAVKYTRQREVARIKIGCDRKDGELEFYVRDNGAGFDPRYAAKLFGVFQRLHKAEEFEGTGVGLANVRRIVMRHGGRTRAEGRAGEGAAFYFTLPLAAKETP